MFPKATPKEEIFLNSPDDLAKFGYFVKCLECKKDLWHTKILSHDGRSPMSTQTLPCSSEIEKFRSDIDWCGFCGRKFYGIGKKGEQLYLIKDGKSGVTRLV